MIQERLSGILFNVFYLTALIFSTPWLIWRWIRYGKNRRGWRQKLWGQVPIRSSADVFNGQLRRCVWLHAVSVGEVNLLAPIIDRLRREAPELELVVSTSTETGYDLARKKYDPLVVFFFPYDFTWAVHNALSRIKPNLIVLAELEIWPNFIAGASRFAVDPDKPLQRGIPIAIVNGRLSESSYRGYRRFARILSPSFNRLALVAAQDETYAQRFVSVGCESRSVVVTGSVKFDGVQTERSNELSHRLRKLAAIDEMSFVFLAGSTQVEEDRIAAKLYLSLRDHFPQLRLILAPRHPERCDSLVQELQQLGGNVVRRSALAADRTMATITDDPGAILLIDVIGELGGWWGVADAAYVGGSMGKRGGQNMIEPAAYGIPVSFGPNTQNFQTIVSQLLASDGAVVVQNQNELTQFVTRCIADPNWASRLGNNAQTEILKHQGAADRTVSRLIEVIQRDN